MPFTDKHSITRRDLIRGAATGMFSLAMRPGITSAQPPAKPPNILFILADDLGYADVSCYGRPDLSTPNIDRIAGRGMRFLQAYANSAVCTATRTALITGRYQYRLRLGLEEPLAGQRQCRSSSGTSDSAVALEEGWLQHDARRQMASRCAAKVWSSEEWLRSFLRISRRCGGLFLARLAGQGQGRSLGRRRFDPSSWLPDRLARHVVRSTW